MIFHGDGWLQAGLLMVQSVRHELFVFAAFWFIVGALDEIAIDCGWIWAWLAGAARSPRLPEGVEQLELEKPAAVFIPAWHESGVIGATIRHLLATWRQQDLRLYIGCYRNDSDTLAAAVEAAGDDPRIRLIVHEAMGPTTKADCLNRLYRAMCADERKQGWRFGFVTMQDAEDMVHPAGLVAIDRGLAEADFVQLPVRPEVLPGSRWISAHYADEFTESHAKAMVVRDWLGAALPAAGVGCGFSRKAIELLADARRAEGEEGPFAAGCLTEDYELGLLVARSGGRGRFLRLRDTQGQLVATRSYFPGTLDAAVRQKTRWVHGIAFQSWDRLGWGSRLVDVWMAIRDRRGPLTALVLFIAYTLIAIEALRGLALLAGVSVPAPPPGKAMLVMLAVSTLAFLWRVALRFVFTAREYGVGEGLWAVLRMPIANIIAIMAGRRALFAYLRSLRSGVVIWDKTSHCSHPSERLQRVTAPC